ncbi:MAG: transglutaminase family protein [Myxococcales bacterium]|nr:transglutaminase family protein [Myxococcales bacterium]
MPSYRVRHTTIFHYSGPASISLNQAFLSPRNTPAQICVDSKLLIEPQPVVSSIREDFFGNAAIFFTVQGPHEQLKVTVTSLVDTSRALTPHPLSTPAWDATPEMLERDGGAAGIDARQFLFDSDYATAFPELVDYGRPSFAPGRPILDAVLDLTHRIHTEFAFDPTATTVSTPLREVLERRRGVCQDFAHLQIACLRGLGIATRYVSGYLLTNAPPGGARLIGADASHAWLAFFCPGFGWLDVDPTNDLMPSEKHITLAWGRDYGDVSPIRGVVIGGGSQALTVAVDVAPA